MSEDLEALQQQRLAEEASDARAGQQMGISAIIITIFLSIGRVMGIAKEMVLSSLGAGAHTDAYKIVYDSVFYTIYTKVEKLMRPTYLPEFVKVRREQGEAQAWHVTSVMAGAQFLLLVVLAALSVIFARPLLRFVGTGLAASPEDFERGVHMLRIMAPALVLFSLSVMPELTLHAYRKFTLPAIAEAAYRTTLVVMFVVLMTALWPSRPKDAVYAAAWAVLIGGCLRFLLQLPGLAKQLRMFRFTANILGNPSARTIVGLMPPVVVGLIFSTIRTWADSRFGSDIAPGIYTCLRFGRQIPDTLGQLLPLAVSFVVYPFLSEWALRGEKDKMADALVAMTRAMAFIFIPTSIGLMLTALPVIRLMYQHGQFTPESARLSALAVYWYAPGLFFSSVDAAINHWYFALKDTFTPNLMGVLFVIVHVAISYLGVYRYGRSHSAQLSWVAAAMTISRIGKIVTLYALIRRRIGRVDGAKVLTFCGKLAVGCTAMSIAVWIVRGMMSPALETWQPPFGGVKVQSALSLSAYGIIGAGVLLATAALLRIEELSIVMDALRRGARKVVAKLGARRDA